ncbi:MULTISPECIES: hypothetical protein [Bradyrhizobium]|uniref:hypothetical protein n=1 Tax=Bradyrhizobium TaxID=374 RepID=UPI001EDAAFEA|nr:hypothetical protein [Bradyrhizobium zhengyangense]MCG2639425.1 hypothetical protein [Bradyrhizobium zhengyangense]
MSNAKQRKLATKPKTKKKKPKTERCGLPKPTERRRLFIDPSLIDVNAELPESVLVHRGTLHLLRTLPEVEAAKILGHIIMAAAHDGSIPESKNEKKVRTAHKRVCEVEAEGPPDYDNEAVSRMYRRDRKTLGLSRPDGRPPKTGQK